MQWSKQCGTRNVAMSGNTTWTLLSNSSTWQRCVRLSRPSRLSSRRLVGWAAILVFILSFKHSFIHPSIHSFIYVVHQPATRRKSQPVLARPDTVKWRNAPALEITSRRWPSISCEEEQVRHNTYSDVAAETRSCFYKFVEPTTPLWQAVQSVESWFTWVRSTAWRRLTADKPGKDGSHAW